MLHTRVANARSAPHQTTTMSWNKPYRPIKNQRLEPIEYTFAWRVYFVTIRAFMDNVPFRRAELNDAMIELLRTEQERQHCNVYTYCLMPDHLHFLVSPRIDGISVLTFTDQYKGKATNTSWKFGWRGKLWQPRYFDHIVRSEESLSAISEYILDNPSRKSLVTKREGWKWSGLMTPLPL